MPLVRPCLLLLLVGSFLLVDSAARGQELGALRDSVHKKKSKPSSKKNDCDDDWFDDHSNHHDDDDDSGSNFFGTILMGAAVAPYYGPWLVFDDPFCERFEGHDSYDPDNDDRWATGISSARLQVDYGTDFSGLESVATKWQVDLFFLRTTLDGSVNSYFEELPGGRHDHLTLGDANIVYRFAQSERTVWRSGIGLNWLADGHADIGFNFTYGFDYLLGDPFVFSTEIDWGTLGRSELFRSRTTLGAQWRDAEIYTGFEYLDVGKAELPTMLFGMRYWY